MANYKLSSAMSVNGKIHLAGSILPASEFATMDEEVFGALIDDAHIVQTDAATTLKTMQEKPSLFPSRRKQAAEPKNSEKPPEKAVE
jgi:hypothetical protein